MASILCPEVSGHSRDGLTHGIKMCCLCTQTEIGFLALVKKHMHVHIFCLYVDSKHCTACCPSARTQTIHFDKHLTVQTACQRFGMHAFSHWI